MFTNFFVKRPVFASVCSLLIILVGVVGYFRLPVREFPDIEPPVVSVTTIFPGANPTVVETEVTEILEDEINGVDGIETLSSVSRQGTSTITVEFELRRDLDTAAQEVRSRLGQVRGELPDDVDNPVVRKEGGGSAVLWFALYGDAFSTVELTDYADRLVVDQLESVAGVSRVQIGGGQQRAMRIWLDPRKLAARNLTVLDVERVLQQENLQIPSGLVEGELNEFPVRTLGRLQDPEEFEATVLRSAPDGAQVQLRDVGYAEVGAETYRTFSRFRQQPAVGLGVVKLSDANTLDVAEGAKATMERLSQDFPEGMQYAIASDDSKFVEVAISQVWQSLFFAIALVILVIFIFLRDWRSVLIPAVTIPVALVGAFAIMFAAGFSINTLTLFALTLATGLVVDDTIVVLENIVRHIEEDGMHPFQAARLGVAEVVFAAIATTVVLVAVFAPITFSSGLTGRLFTEFAVTLAGAVVVSSFVALTLAPTIAGRLLRPGTANNRLFRAIKRGLSALRRSYARSLRWVMGARGVAITVFVGAIGLAYFLSTLVPLGFLPTEDRGSIFTVIRAPEGVSINYTDRILSQVEDIYAEVPEIESYFGIGGFSPDGGSSNVNEGIAFVNLEPWGERERSQQAIVNQVRGQIGRQIAGAIVLPINPSGLPGAGFSQPVQLVLQEPDLEDLADATDQLVGEARQLSSLVNADSNFQINRPELQVQIDRRQAADLGVSVRDISRTLQILLGGDDITNFTEQNRRFEVIVQADDPYRDSLSSIDTLYIRSDQGNLIPASSVVSVSRATTPPQINHFNRRRSATVSGTPAAGNSLGEALDALRQQARDLPETVSTTLSGQSLDFAQAGQSTLFLFGLALVFIFLVLAAQFESYLDPFIILLAVPLALLGAFGSLWLAGLTLNIYGQVGIIMLIGLVTKNSILIVEFANQQREQGRSIARAAMEAGEIRFRPILMTACSTIFGLLPLVFASGAGAVSRQSLGTVVVGGMVVATLLSLYIVPVFYAIAVGLQEKLTSRFSSDRPQRNNPNSST